MQYYISHQAALSSAVLGVPSLLSPGMTKGKISSSGTGVDRGRHHLGFAHVQFHGGDGDFPKCASTAPCLDLARVVNAGAATAPSITKTIARHSPGGFGILSGLGTWEVLPATRAITTLIARSTDVAAPIL